MAGLSDIAGSLVLQGDQAEALARVKEWLAVRNASMSMFFVLSGYAGVGKTTLLKEIVRGYPGSVCLAAPTNKAVKVLQALRTGKDCRTIYSLLGLRVEYDEERLVLTKAETSSDRRYSLIVLDEGSQVSAMLWEYMKESALRGVRYLILGDPKQINPVGETASPIWSHVDDRFEMTKVLRHDNQILKQVTSIRNGDTRVWNNHTGKEGVWRLSNEGFNKRLAKHVERGAFDRGEARAVAWRNRTVSDLNDVIRQYKFGSDAYRKMYLPGDLLVFTGPLTLDDGTKIYTDDELLVTKIAQGDHPWLDMRCYYITGLLYDVSVTVRVVHEDGETKLQKYLTDLAHAARTKDKQKWKEFWAIKESLASTKYGFALTAHRVQGSTYKTAFVDRLDILSNSNEAEALSCFYVACSRPSTKLFVRD